MSEDLKKVMVRVMVTIMDRGKSKKIVEICKENHIFFHLLCYGRGTANSEVLDVLGLGNTDKDVLISMVPKHKVSDIMAAITEQKQLNKPGQGVMFTLPLSGITSILSNLLNQEVQTAVEKELEQAKKHSKYDLVLAMVNQGYTEDLFEAAKEAGARGGTILNARGIGFEDAEKFLGISLHSEKEIVAIITEHAYKNAIMKAICESSGIKTKARGLVFSLPADDLAGFHNM